MNSEQNKSNVLITIDDAGKKLVVIPQIIFPGKRNIAWNEVEKYLVKYVDTLFEIADENDLVYIGKDFADEFCGSVYTRKLVGPVARAKANLVQGIPELIEIATNKRWNDDFNYKHGNKAKNGWYRYNTRFGLPVINEEGSIERYNVYRAVLIVRFAVDNRLYLYDIQNIKKETNNPS